MNTLLWYYNYNYTQSLPHIHLITHLPIRTFTDLKSTTIKLIVVSSSSFIVAFRMQLFLYALYVCNWPSKAKYHRCFDLSQDTQKCKLFYCASCWEKGTKMQPIPFLFPVPLCCLPFRSSEEHCCMFFCRNECVLNVIVIIHPRGFHLAFERMCPQRWKRMATLKD